MNTLKKCLASLGLLVVFLSIGWFVSISGGNGWGTGPMGAIMACASLIWLCAQPIIWMENL